MRAPPPKRPRIPSAADKQAEGSAEVWIPSRFNLAVDLPGRRKAVLNTFTGALIVVRDNMWRNHLAAGCETAASWAVSPDDRGLLQDKGFLVSRDLDELDSVRLRYLSAQFSHASLGVTILPTLACNLRCRYCFEGKVLTLGRTKTTNRDLERAIVCHVAAAARGKRGLNLCWFGGEPLLASPMIRRISAQLIPACEAAGVAFSATIVTNGTLLSQKVVGMLQHCRLKYMQVTVDIPAAEKCDSRGHGTLATVLDNLAFAAPRIPVHLRINLVRDDEAEFDALYAQLLRRKLDRRLAEIYFAYVFKPECSQHGCGFSAMAYPDYTRAVMRERRKARALGLPINVSCQPAPVGCIATKRFHLVIGPDGSLYKCPQDIGFPERAYGSVWAGSPVKVANLVPWLMYDWFQYPRCKACPLLPGCGGGCPHQHRYQPEQTDNRHYCDWYRQELTVRIRQYVRDKLPRPPRRAVLALPTHESP